ncbi:Lanosterol demethylase [Phaffia rhodozyma]|uniref:Cyp51F1 n=1 Tax=Phaffia rhodozyma TaxID=264483 RepID=A0A0F6RA04_PHARH|nr:lanosterol 14 alpha-demethylase [Phaffia rhodozyma]ASN66821.1 Cyp51F1 [Phaffia rhodozyma]CED84182.1 Lanosterol demethylase [Phaffia rhodozyma]
MSSSQSIFTQLAQLIPREQLPSTPILVLAAIFGFPILAVLINVSYQLFWPKDPSLPPVVFHYVPWLGSAVSYGMDPYKFYFDCREKHGDLFTFILIGRKVTVALGPKGNDMILGGKLSQVSAEEAYTHLTTPVFGKDVVYDCPNHVFMEQKKFVKFGLSLENLKAYIPMIFEEFDTMLKTDDSFKAFKDGSKEWSSFPALKTLGELTILTASRTLQGKEVRAGLDKSFAQKYENLDRGFTPINFLFPYLPLPSYWKRDQAQKEMSDFYLGIIEGRRNGESDHEHDMIASLQNQTYKDGRPLSDREIAHIMIALLMAGQHTSSATSSWTLLELAANPEVYQRLYDEQVAVLGQPDGSFRMLEYDDIKNLKVMDSCIRETLRIHAPIHSIFRKVISDISVPQALSAPSESGQYVIPKGYYVLASPGVAQMDARIWENASKWDPARWTDKSGVAAKAGEQYENNAGDKVDYGFGAISKGTESPYQPFGAGRHRCIGESFAYVQLSTILAAFVQNMELKLEGGVPATDYESMIVLPKHPHTIHYRKRQPRKAAA